MVILVVRTWSWLHHDHDEKEPFGLVLAGCVAVNSIGTLLALFFLVSRETWKPALQFCGFCLTRDDDNDEALLSPTRLERRSEQDEDQGGSELSFSQSIQSETESASLASPQSYGTTLS